MDIHAEKPQGYTLNQYAIKYLLNANKRRYQKVLIPRQLTKEQSEAIECGKLQAKAMINSAQNKKNQSCNQMPAKKTQSDYSKIRILNDSDLRNEERMKRVNDSKLHDEERMERVNALKYQMMEEIEYNMREDNKNTPVNENDAKSIIDTIKNNDEVKSVCAFNEELPTSNNVTNISDIPAFSPINMCETIDTNTLPESTNKKTGIFVEDYIQELCTKAKSLANKDNNKFLNNRNIILLNFEDDNVRPVIELTKDKMDVIKNMYDMCDIIVEIEPTNLTIPNAISRNEITPFLFNNFSIRETNKFVDEYFPLIISNLLVQSRLNSERFSNLYQSRQIQTTFTDSSETNQFTLKKTGIIIPDDLLGIQKTVIANNDIKSKLEVTEYNVDYNSLHPLFGTDNFELEQKMSGNSNQNVETAVLVNIDVNKTIVIQNKTKELEICGSHPEFGFIKLFTVNTTNDEIIKYINNQFSNYCFIDSSDINKKLEQTAEYIKYTESLTVLDNSLIKEKNIVMNYFRSNFAINDNINNRMRAVELYDLIVHSNIIDLPKDRLSGFKNRLSQYLKELGLQKKRYNDGYYYYGIIDKFHTRHTLDERIKLYKNDEGKLFDSNTGTDTFTSINSVPETNYALYNLYKSKINNSTNFNIPEAELLFKVPDDISPDILKYVKDVNNKYTMLYKRN